METVVIESPYRGDTKRNIVYAMACMKDSLDRGEAPFLSHLLYTKVLDDDIPCQRFQGIHCNFAWHDKADKIVFYTDFGISKGMEWALHNITRKGYVEKLEWRSLINNRSWEGEISFLNDI